MSDNNNLQVLQPGTVLRVPADPEPDAKRIDGLNRLRDLFPTKAYGRLPKALKKDSPKGKCDECGGYHGLPAIHLDYIGHATVTDRLLSIDPYWNWEPCAWDEHGLPRFVRAQGGNAIGLWIKLTILGVTRLGYGSVEGGAFEPEKQLVGDALRNAAMRFGVALELWSKAELESAALAQEAEAKSKAAPPKTLGKAAERAREARTAEAAKPASAQPAPAQEPEAPADAQGEPPIPVLDPVDEKSVFYAGVYIQTSVIDLWGAQGKNNWAKHTIEAKNPAINNRTWEWVVEGSPDGEREKWLRTGVGLGIAAQKANKLPTVTSQKCAYALYLMKSRHYEEWKDSKATDEFFASGMKDAAPSTDYDPADVH